MRKIPRSVWILGLVSLFNDVAAEMVYPIIPIFLVAVLNAPVSILGLIEGIAESTSSSMKFVFGYLSDRMGKRKIFVVSGYGLATLSKILLAFAYSWWFVLLARVVNRLGKGVRTSARDALLLRYAKKDNRGLIFGFHRSLDSLGAVLGPIAALILLSMLKDDMRLVFLIAVIPSLVALMLLIFFIKEKKKEQGKGETFKLNFRWKDLNPSFKLFFVISIFFALGNSSDAFLILRSKQLGLTTGLVVGTYILYNLVQTLFAVPLGQLADKIGARRVYAIGLVVFAIVYFLFGFIKSFYWVWILFPIYGIYIAATDGVSKAYVSEFISEKEAGSYFGLYQTGIAIAGFFASFVAGILWGRWGPSATFYYGSIMAIGAFLLLLYGKVVRKI